MTMSIYSEDPGLESRMLAIRDDPQNRVKRMAEQRSGSRQAIRFEDIELLWIVEEDQNSRVLPLLEPAEYWAMIRGLTMDLRSARAILWRLRGGEFLAALGRLIEAQRRPAIEDIASFGRDTAVLVRFLTSLLASAGVEVPSANKYGS